MDNKPGTELEMFPPFWGDRSSLEDSDLSCMSQCLAHPVQLCAALSAMELFSGLKQAPLLIHKSELVT